MTLVIGVLALQGAVREHQAALTALGVTAAPGVKSVAQLAAVDGLIIPGGESTTISMLAQRWGLLPALREFVAAGSPVFGSCAGMILLARTILDGRPDQQSIGGIDMVVRRNAFGRQVDSFEEMLDFPALGPDPFPAVFIRAPWVESVGPDVHVLARVPGLPGPGGADVARDRIVAVREGNLLATSFHPELTGDHRVHGEFIKMVRAARRPAHS